VDQVDLIEDFRSDLRLQGRAENTIFQYVKWVKNFAKFYGGDDLAKVTKDDLKRYLNHFRVEKKLSESTVKIAFASISAFMDYLVEEDRITENPVLAFRRRYMTSYKKSSDNKTRQIISIKQAAMLVNSILDVKEKAIVALLFKTGMRRHELADLDVDDIDLEELTIELKPTPKRSNKTVFFDQETAELLKIWLKYRETRIKDGEKALFVSQYGVRFSGTAIKQIVEKHAERVGLHNPKSKRLEDKFTPHCCRHWFTTHLIRAGMPRDYIQELRGDARGEAIDIYNHIDKKELKESYMAHIPRLGIG
jgi:integrase/recombinase XerD